MENTSVANGVHEVGINVVDVNESHIFLEVSALE